MCSGFKQIIINQFRQWRQSVIRLAGKLIKLDFQTICAVETFF